MPNDNQNLGGDSPRLNQIGLRTMESDIQSIQNQGGGEPKPYVPQQSPMSPPKIGDMDGQSVPFKQESAFEPPKVAPAGPPEPPKVMPEIGGEEFPPSKPQKSSKGLFIGLLVVIILIGAAVAGYFLILAPAKVPEAVTPTPQPQQPASQPEPVIPEVPGVGVGEKESEEVPEPEELVVEVGAIPASSHVSLLSTPADSETKIEIASLNLANLKSALQFSPTETPLLREVVLSNADGNLIQFKDVLGVLHPGVFNENLSSAFENDYSLLTYSDSNGTWLGIVARVKSDANLADIQSSVQGIESDKAVLANFYLSEPGAAGDWKNGGSGNVTSRYLTFKAPGASFNYGWSGNRLIIGASFPAFQKITSRL